MAMNETPKRDVTPAPVETVVPAQVTPAPAPAPAPVPAETPKKEERPTWRSKFGVKEEKIIEEVNRIKIVAGVNEYKGNYLVFLAKETSPQFARQFFSMPAYVWQKAITEIQRFSTSIADIEKKAMAQSVLAELRRLKELGIDVAELAKKV